MHQLDGLAQHFAAFVAAAAGVPGGGEGLLAEFRGRGLGGDHRLGAADYALGGLQLRLQALGQAIHRVGHPGGGERVVAGAAGQVAGEARHIGALPQSLRRSGCALAPEQPGHHEAQGDAQPGRQARQRHGAGKEEDQQALEQAVAHFIPLDTWRQDALSLFCGY
ncbi:hypothetical protein D9M68_734100 [compost metagenome]